jgi:hypothetical protein
VVRIQRENGHTHQQCGQNGYKAHWQNPNIDEQINTGFTLASASPLAAMTSQNTKRQPSIKVTAPPQSLFVLFIAGLSPILWNIVISILPLFKPVTEYHRLKEG